MPHPARRLLAVPIALAALLLPVGAPPASAADTGRLAGADRYETAATLATAAYPSGTQTALLARGDVFADALAGAGLVGTHAAPVLLTGRTTLPAATSAALRDLGVSEVLVLGGQGAVSESVIETLQAEGYGVRRLAGVDRTATAASIARETRVGELNGARLAFVVRGDAPADATVIGPVAARGPYPVLLSAPGGLPPSTAAALRDLSIEQVVIIGGTGAVPPVVERRIAEMGISVARVGGRDRADTAQQVAEWAARTGVLVPERVMLSRRDEFADAVASSAYGAVSRAPLLFVHSPAALAYETEQFLVDHSHQVSAVVALGGTGAVGDSPLAVAASAADPPQQVFTYSVATRGSVAADFEHFARHVDWSLTDIRGWSLHHDVRFDQVSSGGDFTIYLASPAAVDAAAPGCSARWSCRVGNDVYINDERWRNATATYANRSLDDYQHYVVNHEVGHWLELGHWSCPGRGQPAPVMQQQSISLDGCASNVWPVESELDTVRQRVLG